MRKYTKSTLSLLLVAAACGAGAYLRQDDPRPAIADELRAAVADMSNHSPFAELIRAEKASEGKRGIVTAIVPCFWSGEGRFGLVEGVYRTTPGYVGGREVVRIEFDPEKTSADALIKLADPGESLSGESCRLNLAALKASRADEDLHPDDQPKFYLQQTELRFIPMTSAQQARVNAYLHERRDYEQFLSPKQLDLLKLVRAHPTWNWTNQVTKKPL